MFRGGRHPNVNKFLQRIYLVNCIALDSRVDQFFNKFLAKVLTLVRLLRSYLNVDSNCTNFECLGLGRLKILLLSNIRHYRQLVIAKVIL